MSAPQEEGPTRITRVGAPQRKRKARQNYADEDFPGSYDRSKKTVNTQAGKDLLNLAQVPEVEKSPTFVGFA
jgi:hypothetical protein